MADPVWLPVRASGKPVDPVQRALELGRSGAVDDPSLQEMAKNRRVNGQLNRRMAQSEMSFATSKPRDPMFYWQQNNLPYRVWEKDEAIKLRAYCRLLYQTHPVIGSAIDIYTKYPLTGMEFTCKDKKVVDFHETLFFDQLKYKSFLPKLGREYWTVGEAWPLGSFNDVLGVWEDEELLNPDDIDVHKSPFLREPYFQMRLPEYLRKVLQDRKPEWEFKALVQSYPELLRFLTDEPTMPVSNILLQQIKFEADTFNPRGIPILMRGLRAVVQEEMLNAAQDAISDRMYTPLLLAKLGASASDLGTNSPWVPTTDDLMEFEDLLDAALAADFRVLTHHFAVSIENVFGREMMPDFNSDFDRLTDRQLQVFGLSRTMLMGAGQGETYAADALNRDLVTQLLEHYQAVIQDFYHQRALVVAEAQGHFDYEERGGKKFVIMDEVVETDPESGERRIVEQPRLLVPALQFKAMNMNDDKDERQFMEALRESGVPISIKRRLTNFDIEFEDEIEVVQEEDVQLAVKNAETELKTYQALHNAGLYIPTDLREKYEPKAMGAESGAIDEGQPIPLLGQTEPAPTNALAPTNADVALVQQQDDKAEGDEQNAPLIPRNRMQERTRPVESDEMRDGMPTAAGLRTVAFVGKPDGGVIEVELTTLEGGPAHVGLRRFLGLKKDVPLDDQIDCTK